MRNCSDPRFSVPKTNSESYAYSICRNIFGTTPRREERQNRQTRLSWHTHLIGVTASELAELLQRNVSIPHRLPGPLNHPKFRQFCLIRPRVRGLDDV